MVCQHIAENIVWWRRRGLNPRPEILYRAFYILSLAYLKSCLQTAGRRAVYKPVTLDLILYQVTRHKTSQCNLTLR